MKVRGWVYIITNEAMPGLIKIGFSTKDPSLRAEGLSNTGIPTAYTLVYDALVLSPRDVEQRTHKSLISKMAGKEWFRCSIAEGVLAIKDSAKDALIFESRHIAIDLYEQAASSNPRASDTMDKPEPQTITATEVKMTEINCPRCDQQLRVPLGRRLIVKCTTCRTDFKYGF